ncbi:hypothetical protein AAVH_07918 [Aphelenchoides avenae]|nr:hypothetical protein AAVH_07918 [Aphelenchus avenae]
MEVKKKMRRRTKKGAKRPKGKKPPEVKKKRPLIGGHKNDQILVGQYRPLLRKDVLERIRQSVEHSMRAAADIQRLRQARFDSIIDTINEEVDASIAHIDKVPGARP